MPIDKAGLSGNKGWLLSNKAGLSLRKCLADISSPCTSRVVRFKGTAREVQGDSKKASYFFMMMFEIATTSAIFTTPSSFTSAAFLLNFPVEVGLLII